MHYSIITHKHKLKVTNHENVQSAQKSHMDTEHIRKLLSPEVSPWLYFHV